MEELNAHYCQLLHVGFIVLREAVHSHNDAWVQAEIDFLHNMPSLISEANIERHRYFWFTERELYLEKIAAIGLEKATSRMRTFYEPTLNEMEPVMLGILRSSGDNGRPERVPSSHAATPPAASISPAR
jgi:hypothetical protein